MVKSNYCERTLCIFPKIQSDLPTSAYTLMDLKAPILRLVTEASQGGYNGLRTLRESSHSEEGPLFLNIGTRIILHMTCLEQLLKAGSKVIVINVVPGQDR